MSGSAGEAAARRGDTLRMGHFCGFAHAQSILIGATFEPVTVSEWKGQLDKKLVIERLTRLIGDTTTHGGKIQGHAWDACGLALYSLGVRMDDVELLGKGT